VAFKGTKKKARLQLGEFSDSSTSFSMFWIYCGFVDIAKRDKRISVNLRILK